jgi:GDP-L-fucose synthase
MRMYVAGINGMVGSAIAIEAKSQGYDVTGKSSRDLDLTNRKSVFDEMSQITPDILVIAAAKVGGIGANSNLPVDFLSVNLQIQTNLLDAAHHYEIERVLFLGSSCIYPRLAAQPIAESSLLTGELEPTNESYAIAKIAGLKLVEAYRRQFGHRWISAMPTNLYGPRDNFNVETAHVLPALLHRFHIANLADAKSVDIWGDGSPLREFLHVEDLARACLILLTSYDEPTPINVGSGDEVSIQDLARLISNTVGYGGEITFNNSKPNGTPRKFLDSTRMRELGWRPQYNLKTGIASTYEWFVANNQEGSSL